MTSRAGKELRIFYAIVVVCIALSAFAIHSANEKSYRVCERTELIKSFAVQLAQRSNKSLPTNPYYVAHPKELYQAQLDNKFVIDIFRPQKCDPGFLGLF